MNRRPEMRRVAAAFTLAVAVAATAQHSAPATPASAERLAQAESREADSDRSERAAAVAPLPAPLAPVPPGAPPSVVAAPASAPATAERTVSAPAPVREIQGEEQSYNAALALIRERADAPAIAALADFSRRFPRSKLLPNVAFWRAEIDFLQEHWSEARTGFLDVVENFPAHPKSADSWYKAGLCSLKMNDNMSAIGQLNEVLRRFPGSEAAGLAEKKLAELSKKT